MGTQIDWKLAKPLAFATVNVYIGKNSKDLKNGLLDKSTFEEDTKRYLKDNLPVLLLNNRTYNGLQPLEHLFVYLLRNNDVKSFDELINVLNNTHVIDRDSYEARDINGKIYYRLSSSSQKKWLLNGTRYNYQAFEVTDGVYIKATDEELFSLYKQFAEEGIENQISIRRYHRMIAKLKTQHNFKEVTPLRELKL